jgi:hypothetical protein
VRIVGSLSEARQAAIGMIYIVPADADNEEMAELFEDFDASMQDDNAWEAKFEIGGIEVERISYAAPPANAPAARNLEGLREQILATRGIARGADGWPVHTGARDSNGWLYHPAIPVCDEGTRVDKLLEAFGIETSFVSMESDASDFNDRWCEEGLSDCSSWVPTPPVGDGWLLLEIYDTEDGPCALFGRDWYEAEKARKKAERADRRAALLAASMGGDKA